MKYNEDIHPCYKSIGEKIENLNSFAELDFDQTLLEFIRLSREKYVTCTIDTEGDLRIRSYPKHYIGFIPSKFLTTDEISFVEEQVSLKFNIGAKIDV